MVARAHALIKTDKYEMAKKDADRAIDILRAGGETTPLISKAFLRSGVASFHLGRYREARNCFVEGQKIGDESGEFYTNQKISIKQNVRKLMLNNF